MLSIDGVHIEKDLGLHLLEGSNEPILPDTRDNDILIPGRHGSYSFKSYMGPKTFFEEILIPTQATLEDVQKIIRKVTPLILDKNGNPKEVELRWDYEPEKWYKAKFSGYISINRIHHAGIFYLPFTAHDPFAYATSTAFDQEPIQYDSEEYYDKGKMFPNTEGFDWKYHRQYSGIHNYSYFVTPLSYMIEGRVINPRITNLNTGKQMMINVSLKADERLYIDAKHHRAWKVKTKEDKYAFLTPSFMMKNKTEWAKMNLFNEIKGDFIEIVSGDNGFLFEGGLPGATVTFKWDHRYM